MSLSAIFNLSEWPMVSIAVECSNTEKSCTRLMSDGAVQEYDICGDLRRTFDSEATWFSCLLERCACRPSKRPGYFEYERA